MPHPAGGVPAAAITTSNGWGFGAGRPAPGRRTVTRPSHAGPRRDQAPPPCVHVAGDATRLAPQKSGYAGKAKADDSSVGFAAPPPTAKTEAAARNLGQGTVRGLWEYQGSRPTTVKDRNFVTQGDVVRGLDRKSGKVLWEKKLAGDAAQVGGHLGTPPAYAGGKLVVATVQGDVVAYAAEGGAEVLRVAIGEEIRFQPALVGGRILVGSAAGTLVAIESGDPSLDGWTMWGGGPEHAGARL